MGIVELAKKLLGKEEFEEFGLEIALSDGCKGEQIIAQIINKLRPC